VQLDKDEKMDKGECARHDDEMMGGGLRSLHQELYYVGLGEQGNDFMMTWREWR
jgi:hypothetical protein